MPPYLELYLGTLPATAEFYQHLAGANFKTVTLGQRVASIGSLLRFFEYIQPHECLAYKSNRFDAVFITSGSGWKWTSSKWFILRLDLYLTSSTYDWINENTSYTSCKQGHWCPLNLYKGSPCASQTRSAGGGFGSSSSPAACLWSSVWGGGEALSWAPQHGTSWSCSTAPSAEPCESTTDNKTHIYKDTKDRIRNVCEKQTKRLTEIEKARQKQREQVAE